jgi:hypothetical protein
MNEPDPLDTLLHEWKAPEPAPEMDRRIAEAYRRTFRNTQRKAPGWRGFWNARVSVPVPALLAAMAVIALVVWYRSSVSTSTPASAGKDATGVVTRVSAVGFQPLPNGEARIIPVKEISR